MGMREAIARRYGIGYVPPSEPQGWPEAPPLYRPGVIGNAVRFHGQWCKAKACYPATIERINEIMRRAEGLTA